MKTFSEFKQSLNESKGSIDPPNILIMKRKTVRMYPNKQRVALYFVDKVNKYITVPYTEYQWASGGAPVEEETIKE